MRMKDIIEKLSGGELGNVFTFDDDDHELNEASRRKMLPQLNLGVTLLHQRFFLKEGTEVINLEPGTFTYPLVGKDILRIEKVEDLEGNEFELDVEGDMQSPKRTSLTKLQIHPKFMEKTEATGLLVTYRAGPEKLVDYKMGKDPAYIEVDLPYQFLEPLSYFIASQFLNPMGASEGMHEGNNYAAKYEQACRTLEMQNFDLDRYDNEETFHSAGWV